MSTEKSTYLFLTEGGSDKEYHAHLRTMGSGWVVQYANGPRGRVGQTKLNSSTESPVAYEVALKVFDDLVKSKGKKGYTSDDSGVRFTNTEHGASASGHVQQLPTSIDNETALLLIHDSTFGLQEKANGERRTLEITESGVKGINKLGLYVNIPETWVRDLSGIGNYMLDGEQIGETFYAFDLLIDKGQSIKNLGAGDRYQRLANLVEGKCNGIHCVQLLKMEFSTDGKRNLLQEIDSTNREGVVYKSLNAPYEAGRSSSVFKYKLLESSTCIVVKRNAQRSVQVGLLDASGSVVELGNVTIPANQPSPTEGDLLEVQYLYYNPGGAFEQPVSLGIRQDILRSECTFAQVTRIKPGVEMDANGARVIERSRERA